MNSAINWQLIAQAVAYYERLGYKYVEVPWIVSSEALGVTLPPGKEGLQTQDGSLIGSAEQGFIQLLLDGKLSYGRYLAATPCFRDDTVDELHQRTFFKVELIYVYDICAVSVDTARTRLAQDAIGFFLSVSPPSSLTLPKTKSGHDIELGGVEVGSYGCREYKGHRWIYGTGLAEPRFSVACRMYADRA